MKNKSGFTLIELIISLMVGMIILVAIYAAMEMAQKTSANTGRKVLTQGDTRAVLDLMSNEIQMASSYDFASPLALKNPWRSYNRASFTCGVNGSGVVSQRGIQYADQNSIVIEMDLKNPVQFNYLIGGVGDTNEIIYYVYNGADTISRGVGCSGSPGSTPEAILGGLAAGVGTGTNVANNSVIPPIPVFQYFDWTNTPITNANLVASPAIFIPLIRRIQITIVADTESVDVNTRQPKRMVYQTSVVVRNHALLH